LGLKLERRWPKLTSLSPGKLRKHELLKNPPNPFGTKRKVVGKGRFSLIDFLPRSLKIILNTVLGGVKVGDFFSELGFRSQVTRPTRKTRNRERSPRI
jgi:hypothetical protein